MVTASDGLPALRARLSDLRRDALHQLGEGDRIDSGLLRVVADAGALLDALDEEAAAALVPERDARAMVLDDNASITLVVFTADRQSAAATLSPAAAIRVAGQLICSAVRRL